jgi:Zn-dependent peptidase ImmA (M78 family)
MMKKWNLLIEEKAAVILANYGYNGGAVDIKAVAAKYNIDVIEHNFNTNPFSEDSVSGTLVIKGDKKTIGVDTSHVPIRKRFTIAHELGHFFLGHGKKDGIMLDTFTLYRNNISKEGTQKQEIEANAFAAALLMPKTEVSKMLEKYYAQYGETNVAKIIEVMASYFDVSQISMAIRLNRLGLINTDEYIF